MIAARLFHGVVVAYKVRVMPAFLCLCLLVSLMGSAGSAYADQDLAVRKNCSACHLVEKRKYGPNFREIAQKYAGQGNAVEVLARKIRHGGAGVWGEDMMPPQPQVSESEAQILAKYILSLK
jgi:cytochrome c